LFAWGRRKVEPKREKVLLRAYVPPVVQNGRDGTITVYAYRDYDYASRVLPQIDDKHAVDLVGTPSHLTVTPESPISVFADFNEDVLVLSSCSEVFQEQLWDGDPTTFKFSFQVSPHAGPGKQQGSNMRAVTIPPGASEQVSTDIPVAVHVESAPAPLPLAVTEEQLNFNIFSRIAVDILPEICSTYFVMRWNAKYPEHPWNNTPADGELFMDGSLPCDVPLPGTLCLKHRSGKMVTNKDLTASLVKGDLIHLVGEAGPLTVVEVRPRFVSVNHAWAGDDRDGVQARGQRLRCEKKLADKMAHGETKVRNGDTRQWDISLFVFALMQSSHGLLEGMEKERAILQRIRIIRNQHYGHASACHMSTAELDSITATVIEFTAICVPGRVQHYVQQINGLRTIST